VRGSSRVAGVVVTLTMIATTLVCAVPATAETHAPAKWDPRVTKYVRFVERTRKLQFDHPVPVKFLGDAAFVKAYQGDNPKITKKDRAEAERYAGQLRALGLVEGPVDLIQSERDLGATDVVGFYDQEKEALFVRGKDLGDTDTRVTLVHELTHALQDQRFDLDKLDRRAETSGQDFAITALVEGDAVAVEDAYVGSLPRAEQDAYDASATDETPEPDAPPTGDIPPVLELFESLPYVYGPQYIDTLKARGGLSHVDHAFVDPPRSEEAIVDPVAATRGTKPATVAAPKLAKHEKRDGSPDDFGALSLYFVLASRLDPETALRAAEGWGGDRYVAFTQGHDQQECVRATFRGGTRVDGDEIADALDEWAAKLPADAAHVERHGRLPTVTACDTKGTTAPTEDTLDTAVNALANRNELVLEFLHQRTPIVVARCVSDRLVADPEITPLLSKDTLSEAEQTLVGDRVTRYMGDCR